MLRLCGLFILFAGLARAGEPVSGVKTFPARGVVRELKADGHTAVIQHEAISNYMDAMTMPFKVRDPKELSGLQAGDEIAFRLNVTETNSWIDRVVKTGTATLSHVPAPAVAESPSTKPRHPLMDYKFTNELGRAVSLGDFPGQALAITFFFTRCPVPDYCPRLSRNFQEASQKLASMPEAPTNWHFISITFDPEFDTPRILKAYADSYHYDPKRWTFLTGPPDKIAELARLSDVKVEREGAGFNHDFRTLIIDAGGRLQMVFPTSGDLSDAIVGEIVKAAAMTNRSAAENQK